MKKTITLLLILYHFANAQDGTVFLPQNPAKIIQGLKINENLSIDGNLKEDVWQKAEVASDFFKQFPNQDGKPVFDTQVRILYTRCSSFFYLKRVEKRATLRRKTAWSSEISATS